MEKGFFVSVFLMSITYLGLAYGMSRDNARYFLAGYNTMSDADQAAFDIDGYLNTLFKPFFKKLAIFPVASLLLLRLAFTAETAVTVWALVQSLPFMWFLWRSRAFYS